MSIELCLNIGVFELGVTSFAHADDWGALLYDPQFALLHDGSLAHLAYRAQDLWISNGTTTNRCICICICLTCNERKRYNY